MNKREAAGITWSQALAWRMRQQLLDPLGSPLPEAVVKRLGAVKASAAELSVRTRQVRSRPGEVERAIADGRLIKTFAFRGGTHLFTPEDAGVYLALRASSRMWELPSWQNFYNLNPSDWAELRKAVREALANGPLTRDELQQTVTAHHKFKHLRQRFTETLLKPLTWLGDMSFGASRGRTTFQRLDDNPRWAGIPDFDAAGPKAIEAYFRAYGPATMKNLRYWLGEGLGAGKFIKSWFASLADKLVAVKVGGADVHILRAHLDELTATSATDAVRLLPAYDQWVMGPGTADANVVPPGLRAEISRGANPVIFGGRVAGTWSIAEDKLAIVWRDKQKAPNEHLDEEVKRLAKILEQPLKWKITRKQ